MSWKNYGGLHKLDNFNNVTVHSFVADLFTLRESYFGTFDICGEFHVSGNAHMDSNVYGNNVIVTNDISTNRLFVVNKTEHYNDVDICGNLTVHHGNVHLLRNMDASGYIYLRNELYLGNSFNSYLYGTDTVGNIGVNTHTPIATLDISSAYPLAFNVGSAIKSQVYAVPLQNNGNKGFVLSANTSTSRLGFYNDASVTNGTNAPDAFIQYSAGGVLTLDTSTNINLLSTVSLTNRSATSHIMGETVVIYDTSAGSYLYPIYQNTKSTTGNALSLIANDSSSNTFMNVIAPNGQGISYGGGVYPNDSTRSMGSIGWRDVSSNYKPAINIISGKSNIRQKTTIGINTQAPTTESCAFDVNGPMIVKNGELTITQQADFEIMALSSGRYPFSNNAVAIGTPYNYVFDASFNYKQKILYTNNGGENWYSNYDLFRSNFERNNNIMRCAYVFDSSLTVIAGDGGYAFYTNNGYTNSIDSSFAWHTINTLSVIPNPASVIKSVYVNSSKRLFFGVNNVTGNSNIVWADVSGQYGPYGFDISNSVMNIGSVSISGTNISAIDGSGNFLFVAYSNKIATINNANASTPSVSSIYTNTYGRNYNTLSAFDANNAVAAGVNIISYTRNGGSSWTDISLNGITVNKIYACDASNAIAVCTSGNILTSKNGYATWSQVENAALNGSGNANTLTDPNYNLTNVAMVDANNFYITKTIQVYNGSSPPAIVKGNTSLFHAYLPNLFNNVTNYVFDIYGSARFAGDLNVNDGGKISSNNQTFRLLDNSVNQINIGGDASYVYLSSFQNGTTVAKYDLNVLHDTSLNGNLQVGQVTQSMYYEGLNRASDIKIGGLYNASGVTRTVQIGNFNASPDMINNIYLGGKKDNTVLGGNIKINNNLQIGSILNVNYTNGTDPTQYNSSTAAGSGIWFADCSNANRGEFVVSQDLTGFIFKSVQQVNNNMVKLDIKNMIVPANQSSALTYLYPTVQGLNVDSSYTIGICPVDPSNIVQLNKSLSSPTQQTVDISTSFVGPVTIGKYPANPAYPLEISGNVYHPLGFIWQF